MPAPVESFLVPSPIETAAPPQPRLEPSAEPTVAEPVAPPITDEPKIPPPPPPPTAAEPLPEQDLVPTDDFSFLTEQYSGDRALDPAPPLVVAEPVVSASQRADTSRTLAAYQLAAVLAVAALFGVAPAVWDVAEYLQIAESPFVARWAFVLLFLGVVQLAYAVYLFQLPDWTSVWVVTLFSLVSAAGYAAVLGLVLVSSADAFLIGSQGLQLADKLAGGKAALWCLCMVSLSTLLAFFAGRLSVGWQRAEMLLRSIAA